MITLHPTFIRKEGKKQFAVLPADEFESLQVYLADLEDLLELRKAKAREKDAPSRSLADVRKRIAAKQPAKVRGKAAR